MAEMEGKLRNLRVKILEDTTAALLETAVNNYLAGISDPTVAGHDREFISIQYQVAVAESSTVVAPAAPVRTQTLVYSCMIVYTE